MASEHESFLSLCRYALELGASELSWGAYSVKFGRPRQVIGEPDVPPVHRPQPRVQDLTHEQQVAQAQKRLEELLKAEIP